MMRLAFLLWIPAALAGAGQLSEFSCARPKPYDPGSWQNVSLAASAVNGAMIQPGEVFPFEDAGPCPVPVRPGTFSE